jgi:hypothetical protein
MARTEVAAIQLTRTGVFTAETVGIADGHMFQNAGRTFILIRNSHATLAKIVTIQTPQTILGLAVAELTVSVPALASLYIGPFPIDTFNQASGSDVGKVYVDYETPANQFITVYRM